MKLYKFAFPIAVFLVGGAVYTSTLKEVEAQTAQVATVQSVVEPAVESPVEKPVVKVEPVKTVAPKVESEPVEQVKVLTYQDYMLKYGSDERIGIVVGMLKRDHPERFYADSLENTFNLVETRLIPAGSNILEIYTLIDREWLFEKRGQ